MKPAQLRGLETFAADRLCSDRGYAVLWPQASLFAGRLLELISQYEKLPRSHRRFHFALTPTAIMVSRFRSEQQRRGAIAAAGIGV